MRSSKLLTTSGAFLWQKSLGMCWMPCDARTQTMSSRSASRPLGCLFRTRLVSRPPCVFPCGRPPDCQFIIDEIMACSGFVELATAPKGVTHHAHIRSLLFWRRGCSSQVWLPHHSKADAGQDVPNSCHAVLNSLGEAARTLFSSPGLVSRLYGRNFRPACSQLLHAGRGCCCGHPV